MIGETGVDLTKEKALSKAVTVAEAQARLKQLLIELHRCRQQGHPDDVANASLLEPMLSLSGVMVCPRISWSMAM